MVMPYVVLAVTVAGRKREYTVGSRNAGSTARFLARSSVSFSAPTRSAHCHEPVLEAETTSNIDLRRLVVRTRVVKRDSRCRVWLRE